MPYLWSAAYAVLLAVRSETYEQATAERQKDTVIGGIALLYAIWLLYAGGVKYLLLSALLYALARSCSPRPSVRLANLSSPTWKN